MFTCSGCGAMFLTQREADLCTPKSDWLSVYGAATADPFGYLR